MTKSFEWLRGIKKAKCTCKNTGLMFLITKNIDATSRMDRYSYRCYGNGNKLLFDRKIDFTTALVAVNSWIGKVETEEDYPVS